MDIHFIHVKSTHENALPLIITHGGHFAAWEEPELFATEIRAAFKSLR